MGAKHCSLFPAFKPVQEFNLEDFRGFQFPAVAQLLATFSLNLNIERRPKIICLPILQQYFNSAHGWSLITDHCTLYKRNQ